MTRSTFTRRATALLATLGVAGTLGACDNFLSVENPGAIDEESLNDKALIEALAGSAAGNFQDAVDNLAYASAILTDEAVTGHNFVTWQDIDRRIIEDHNSTMNSEVYQPLHTARYVADDAAERLRTLVPDASKDVRLARTLAYAGYGYVYLGEFFDSSPLGGKGAAIPAAELSRMAITRFDESIKIATAAGGKDGVEVASFARVGAARAALQVGDRQKAVAYASQVPASFVMWSQYSDNSSDQWITFYGATTGANHNLGVDASFRGLADPRVRHAAKGTLGHNRLTILYKPFQSSSFSGWDPATPKAFEKGTKMRIASGLEARYIVAEAGGMSDAQLRAFIDERRAVGNQAAFTGTDLMAELREQRRRDFYMDGHRLGDLRRYLELYKVDQFPSGAHPNSEWGQYASAQSFAIPRAEKVGNPDL